MLLKSSLFILLLSNIVIDNIKVMMGITFILFIMNIILNKDFKKILEK
ncbi:hypothetical protein [Fusobacterium varium]|nr:hypothetical protein [Fusobacterium varium]